MNQYGGTKFNAITHPGGVLLCPSIWEDDVTETGNESPTMDLSNVTWRPASPRESLGDHRDVVGEDCPGTGVECPMLAATEWNVLKIAGAVLLWVRKSG